MSQPTHDILITAIDEDVTSVVLSISLNIGGIREGLVVKLIVFSVLTADPCITTM